VLLQRENVVERGAVLALHPRLEVGLPSYLFPRCLLFFYEFKNNHNTLLQKEDSRVYGEETFLRPFPSLRWNIDEISSPA
jgi:hypothetical protein